MGKALTTPNFWNRTTSAVGRTYPNPTLCRMDYEITKIFHPFLEPKRGGEFVELGCGSSYLLPYFGRRYGFKISGIDFSDERLTATRYNLSRSGICGKGLVCCDFRSIPEGWQNKFDVVYSGGVIEHFESQMEILGVFANYLKQDGIMVTTVPHLKGFWGNLGRKLNREVDAGYIRMGLDDIVEAHHKAGLEVVYASYFRWLDFSIVNYSLLPLLLRKVVCTGIITLDLFLNLLFRIHKPKWLPKALYSDMVVVSKRC